MLRRRYEVDRSHVVNFEPFHSNENLSYEEKPKQILAREVKTLCNREIALLKVSRQNHQCEKGNMGIREGDEMKY